MYILHKMYETIKDVDKYCYAETDEGFYLPKTSAEIIFS